MKSTIFTNWSFMRFLRLGLGLAVLVQAVMAGDLLFAVLGVFLTAMPVFNIGCCSTNGCNVPPVKNSETSKNIHYEEVV